MGMQSTASGIILAGGISRRLGRDKAVEPFEGEPLIARVIGRLSNVASQTVVVVNDANGQQRNKLYPLQVGYKKYGASGIEVSDWFPHIGGCIDDIAVVRSMWTTDDNHGAQYQFENGRHNIEGIFPNIGAWVSYGLGSLNNNLPAYIKMGVKYPQVINDGDYLGRACDAVRLKVDPNNPLPYAKPELDLSREEQEFQFTLINRLNRIKAVRHPKDEALRARTKSYELAYRMQTAVPEVINFDDETAATQQLYGLNNSKTRSFGMQLLAARRFVEKGVRFVKIMHGAGAAGAWDAHGNLRSNHTNLAAQVDSPIAGLIIDLKQRGLLDETLVVWGGEFGRTVYSQGKLTATSYGRDHHPRCFTIWMAGGGIKGGMSYGKTDDYCYNIADNPVHVYDLHATIMHCMGIDHERLIHRFQGRDYRLTDVHGNVVSGILA